MWAGLKGNGHRVYEKWSSKCPFGDTALNEIGFKVYDK
jgi:hypothetical protein